MERYFASNAVARKKVTFLIECYIEARALFPSCYKAHVLKGMIMVNIGSLKGKCTGKAFSPREMAQSTFQATSGTKYGHLLFRLIC